MFFLIQRRLRSAVYISVFLRFAFYIVLHRKRKGNRKVRHIQDWCGASSRRHTCWHTQGWVSSPYIGKRRCCRMCACSSRRHLHTLERNIDTCNFRHMFQTCLRYVLPGFGMFPTLTPLPRARKPRIFQDIFQDSFTSATPSKHTLNIEAQIKH